MYISELDFWVVSMPHGIEHGAILCVVSEFVESRLH